MQNSTDDNNEIKRDNTYILRYTFMGNVYSDKNSLFNAMAMNWEEGKKQLFRGILSGFCKTIDPEMAGICIDAEEAIKKGENEDSVFFKTIYRINNTTDTFYWLGDSYEFFA